MKNFKVFAVSFFMLFYVAQDCFAAQATWCKDNKPIRFASITWDSGQFISQLAAQVLGEHFQCKSEFLTGSTAVTEAALVAQDLDIWGEQWHSKEGSRTAVMNKGIASGKVTLEGDILKGGTVEGWFVPDFVVHGDSERKIKPMAPDLKSVSDLIKYKALFADDETPSKGRFLNCPTGWDCERYNNKKIVAYNLDKDYVNFKPGTGGALDATISSAFIRGKPILFYYWSPATLIGKYKMFQLEEAPYTEECWKTLVSPEPNNKTCPSATPPYQLSFGVSKTFKDAAPEMVEVIKRIQLTGEQLNKALAEMTDRKVGADVVAKDFMKKNPELVNYWVTGNTKSLKN